MALKGNAKAGSRKPRKPSHACVTTTRLMSFPNVPMSVDEPFKKRRVRATLEEDAEPEKVDEEVKEEKLVVEAEQKEMRRRKRCWRRR